MIICWSPASRGHTSQTRPSYRSALLYLCTAACYLQLDHLCRQKHRHPPGLSGRAHYVNKMAILKDAVQSSRFSKEGFPTSRYCCLPQVQGVLKRLETMESLFPSCRLLVLENPSWGDVVFKTRSYQGKI